LLPAEDSKQILKMETQSRSWRWRLKADLEDGDSKQILKMGNIGTKCWLITLFFRILIHYNFAH